jgi:hypothetical protein
VSWATREGAGREPDPQKATTQPPTKMADSVDARRPAALARLSSYRSAAQAIRRLDTTLRDRGARMIALMQKARAESDRWTRELAEQVVWAQAEWMLEADEALRQNQMRGRLETAARRLRLKGYECCPTCEQRLSDPADWSFWGALRQAELDRLAALDRETGEAA